VDWQFRLITLYDFICKQSQEDLWVYCQRLSPHTDLTFSDEEVLCIDLWGILDKRRELRAISMTRGALSMSGSHDCLRREALCNG
jgi:hypothetical protein